MGKNEWKIFCMLTGIKRLFKSYWLIVEVVSQLVWQLAGSKGIIDPPWLVSSSIDSWETDSPWLVDSSGSVFTATESSELSLFDILKYPW